MTAPRWFRKSRLCRTALAVLGPVLLLALAACGKTEEKAVQAAAAAPPPPSVVVAEVAQKSVPIYAEFVARTDAKETVEIRARVQAFLEMQHFIEGSVVKKDQLLFTLDKREYEAQLQQAKAQLAKAEADLAFAKDNTTVETAKANLEIAQAQLNRAVTDERRLKPLAEKRAVPQQDYDTAAANLDAAKATVDSRRAALNTAQVNQKSNIEQAEAAVQAAKAAIAQAELNVSYCTIRSPIDGLIGKREVAPGNLVGKGEATLLDTVSTIDPIRVYASISESEYLRFAGGTRKRSLDAAGAPVSLELTLADGRVYPHKGKFVFADRAVDLKTGTLAVIAEFPNPEALLRPGQFGRMRAIAEVAQNAIVVPQRAVQEIQGTKTVLVVGTDNLVTMRTISPGESVDDLLIVRDGLKPGERVIVDGVQKARPGSPVNPSVAGGSTPPAKAEAKPTEKPAETKPAKKAGGK